MSFLSETYLQDVRVMYPNPFDRTEWRGPQRGLLTAVNRMSAGPNTLLSSQVQDALAVSEGRVVEIPVVTKGAVTLTNARTCTIAGFSNTSALMNVTWVTLVADVMQTPAQYFNNEVAAIEDLRKKLQLVKEAFEGAEEAALLARLDTEKDSYYESTLVGAGNKYPLTADAMRVSLADQDLFYNDLDAIMQRDDFSAGQYIIGSTELMPSARYYAAQGNQNSQNTGFQFANKDFEFTNAIVNGAGVTATGYVVPDGFIAASSRLAADSRARHRSTDGTEWGVTDILGLSHSVGYQFKSNCKDESALNATGMEHLTATLHEKWQFSYDFAILTEYNSDSATRAGGVKKFEFLPA
jgi:hypothetical protein